MENIVGFLLLASIICLPIALVNPTLFKFILGAKASREKAGLIFVELIFFFFALFGAVTDSKDTVVGFIFMGILGAIYFGLYKLLFTSIKRRKNPNLKKDANSQITVALESHNHKLQQKIDDLNKNFEEDRKRRQEEKIAIDYQKMQVAQASCPFRKCPVCSSEKEFVYEVIQQLWGIINKEQYICQNCQVRFEKKNDKYKLLKRDISLESAVFNEYQGEILTVTEWVRIGNGGMSDAKQAEADKKAERERRISLERKRRHLILSGNIMPITTDLNLKEGEQAFYQVSVSRLADMDYIETHSIGKEKKKGVVTRALVGDIIFGPAGAIIGGASAGSKIQTTSTQLRVTRTEQIDSGTLVFTNNRVVFMGNEIIALNFDDIISFDAQNSYLLNIRYPNMHKNERYKFRESNTNEAKIHYLGLMRKIGRDKTTITEDEVDVADFD